MVQDGTAWGSGVVVSPRLIVTAFHVAGQGLEFRLEFPGGESIPARLKEGHPESDVAILLADKDLPISPRPLTVIPPPAGSTNYIVGYRPGYPESPAARIASPFGIGGPIPLYRPYGASMYSTLLFDSSAGPGDSGGALLDSHGGLAGIIVGGSVDPTTGRKLTNVVPAALVQAIVYGS